MRVVLSGFGTVNQAFARLVATRADALIAQHGLEVRIVGVIDSRGSVVSERPLDATTLIDAKKVGSVAALPGGSSETDAAKVLARCAPDVLIQASPSDVKNPDPAIRQLTSAFARGIHAVTATKAPIAIGMHALRELAAYNKVLLRYSATVGASTPVLATAERIAAADRILGVRAVLNGTTNFILTKMLEQSWTFADALAEAQRLGWAETDPTNDVDGIDTAVKMVIIANHAGIHVGGGGGSGDGRASFERVALTGIRGVTAQDIASAKGAGKLIKLVGSIGPDGVRVAPTLIEPDDALNVAGGINAAVFTTENCGEVVVKGAGAGGTQTATALLRDVVDIWHSTHDG
ncbi:MAG: homoserine dehydrogenase [Planctomycetota bacterium]|nr:homoserine dehydrogenase [Planctomycetota bacterium]